MIVDVPRLTIGLGHHINHGAPKAGSSVHMVTNMQVKRSRLPVWRAPCLESWCHELDDGWFGHDTTRHHGRARGPVSLEGGLAQGLGSRVTPQRVCRNHHRPTKGST